MRALLTLLLFLFIINYVGGATIYGTVYDLELNPAKNSIVSINSTPEQKYVAKDGTYAFNLPKGGYVIEAMFEEGLAKYTAKENITISDDGRYVMDLLLFPDTSEEEKLLEEEMELPIEYNEKSDNKAGLLLIIGGIILVILSIVSFFAFKSVIKKKKDLEFIEAEPVDEVLEFIKKEGGRVTQKEIRKKFPMSEAKISLMLTELEEQGKIRKIKRGKGNIILLNR